ncbi:MAG: hypothetical protein COV44_10070 [Deltaproteobacteria bacterium CG11_big_fil_rev_8_21_14_0_20_45_16]|nr:MAG: hypothetical protein COV44_10070 [Deltaproteobacteria bacterium CG11_big_fil_rev_8_21_14_0_20_45_16]
MNFSPILILIHLAIYLGLIVVLKKLYFDPVLKLLRRREALTLGRQQSSVEMLQEIAQLKSRYAHEMESIKSELDVQRQRAMKQLQDEAAKATHDVKRENKEKFSQHQEALNEQLETLRRTLPDLGSKLGDDIIEAIINTRMVRL